MYQIDYAGGDHYIVVEGYLGEDALEEFKKVVKELKLEIEDLRKGVNLEKDQVGGNEGLALAVLNDTYPEGLVIEALGGMDKKNTQDFKALLDEKIAMRDELRTVLDELGIEGIKKALVNGEYTEDDIETYLGKSTLDDAKRMLEEEKVLYVSVAEDHLNDNTIDKKYLDYDYLEAEATDYSTGLIDLDEWDKLIEEEQKRETIRTSIKNSLIAALEDNGYADYSIRVSKEINYLDIVCDFDMTDWLLIGEQSYRKSEANEEAKEDL